MPVSCRSGFWPDLEQTKAQTKRNSMNRRRSVYPLCRHTKTDGRLCGSPACGSSLFCYFHNKQHHIRRAPPRRPRADPQPACPPSLAQREFHPERAGHGRRRARRRPATPRPGWQNGLRAPVGHVQPIQKLNGIKILALSENRWFTLQTNPAANSHVPGHFNPKYPREGKGGYPPPPIHTEYQSARL